MSAIFAKGTELKVGDGTTPTEVFTLIPGIRTITGPSMAADVIDVTSHDTPGGFRQKMQGLKDWGTLSFEFLWDPAETLHQQLFDDYKTGEVRNYTLTYPTATPTTLTFAGFVGPNPTTSPFDGALTKNVDLIILADPEPDWNPPATGMATAQSKAVPPWAPNRRRETPPEASARPEAEARA